MEDEARNFYRAAIAQTSDAGVRQLLGDLAAEEGKHYDLAETMDEQQKASGATNKETNPNAAVSSSKLFSRASLD